eukprot:SAG22_NODE_22119_length_251_cov_0.888158_1_plen_32_part_01
MTDVMTDLSDLPLTDPTGYVAEAESNELAATT